MNILFDINHPVDVNFFKNAILSLKADGHSVKVIYRERGKLETILRYELKDEDIEIKRFGSHKKSFIGKILFQLLRDLKIFFYLLKNKIDIVACFGPTSAIATRLAMKPYIAFDDDFEYKIPFYHANLFCTKHIFPDYIQFSNKRTFKYHGFKELAYLHPDYLKTNVNSLKKYGIEANKYVFIREIANVSLNYRRRDTILDSLISYILKKNLKILLSLEDKTLVEKYKSDCIILNEPVSDLYSLMKYALFAISSGDTVARETALLGVPTIYTGGRKMAVNYSLIEIGAIYDKQDIKQIKEIISNFNKQTKENLICKINKQTKSKWDNTTTVILNNIKI